VAVTGPLRTDRLVLRRWRRSDLEPLAALNAYPVVMTYFPSALDGAASDAVVAAADTGTPRAGGWRAFEIGWTEPVA
jgi:RimJ/RimL family protein N-acetyltransferase